MKLWAGITLSLLVLLVFSLQVKAEEQAGHSYGRKGRGSFQNRDINKDGKISSEEWLQYYTAKFKKRDTNGDGFLTEEEMRGSHRGKKWGQEK